MFPKRKDPAPSGSDQKITIAPAEAAQAQIAAQAADISSLRRQLDAQAAEINRLRQQLAAREGDCAVKEAAAKGHADMKAAQVRSIENSTNTNMTAMYVRDLGYNAKMTSDAVDSFRF